MVKDEFDILFEKIKPDIELEKATVCKMKALSHKRTIIRPKKAITVLAVSLAAMLSLGCVVYAVSPVFREFIMKRTGIVQIDPDNVVSVKALPQEPANDFSLIYEAGEKLPDNSLDFDGDEIFSELPKYEIEASSSADEYSIEKIAYGNGDVLILKNDGLVFDKDECAVLNIDADFSLEYNNASDYGELVTVGYIKDNTAVEIYFGKTDGENLRVKFVAPEKGTYRFYIINCSAGLQNYKKVSVTKTGEYTAYEYWWNELQEGKPKYSLDIPVKPASAVIQPTEITWTQPYMNGATAEMMITGIRYSPEIIEVDLQMLSDCIVKTTVNDEQIEYLNNVRMFSDKGNTANKYDCDDMKDEFIPLKLKMDDGTLKNVCFTNVSTDLIAVMPANSETETFEDYLEPTANIPSDYPAVVKFDLHEIIDYTDVEAIVFCGYEIPINVKDFEPADNSQTN